jgi:hypothetical protein
VELYGGQFASLVSEGKVKQGQSTLIDMVTRGSIPKGAHHLNRCLKLIGGDEQIDVAGEAPAGIAIEGFAQLRALQGSGADSGIGEHVDQSQRDELEERALSPTAVNGLFDPFDEAVVCLAAGHFDDAWAQRRQEPALAQSLE